MVSPEAADVLTEYYKNNAVEYKAGNAVAPRARQFAHWISRECAAFDPNGMLRMPLVQSINSNQIKLSFLAGENIQLMEGSIISPDSIIGANTYVGFNCHISRARIGRYVSIADNVLVGPGEHQLDRLSTSSLFYQSPYDELTKEACVVQDDVWIGAASIIRRGITIGTGAVIGANSFVNKDVSPFAIMVGSPARCIGYRFKEQTVAKILASRWWALPLEDARNLLEQLTRDTTP